MYNIFVIIKQKFNYTKHLCFGGVKLDIGQKIRQLRKVNELTLEELASRTELTKGFLSQLENNLTSPSISTLEDILEALGSSLAEFFSDATQEKYVFKKNDFFIDERDDYKIKWIVPNAQKQEMEPILIEINPGFASQVMEPHYGEEFGYVLQGSVRLIYGKKRTTLHEGETFYIKGETRHYLENHTKEIVKILWVSNPPSF